MKKWKRALLWSSGANPLAYTNKVIALSPIGYWPMAEPSGTTVVDASGNGRNGVYKGTGEPLLNQPGIGDGRTCPLFDGSNDFANVFSVSLQGAFSGAEGTLSIWLDISNAAFWTDGLIHRAVQFQVDASNLVRMGKTAVNNQINGTYIAGGTTNSVNLTTAGPLTWVHLAITWSASADQVKFYVSGAQSGATLTGLGVWVGSLATTTVVAGAAGTSGTNPWGGYLAHAAVWSSVLSAAQIATLAVVP